MDFVINKTNSARVLLFYFYKPNFKVIVTYKPGTSKLFFSNKMNKFYEW